MAERKFQFHEGKRGAALAIQVIPRAQNNEIVEVLRDGTIKVRLKSSAAAAEINTSLIEFLADVLNVPMGKIEIVAGESSRGKLVSVLDLDSQAAHDRIIRNLG